MSSFVYQLSADETESLAQKVEWNKVFKKNILEMKRLNLVLLLWSLCCFAQGREYHVSVKGSNYDLIFMDIQMPKMDGYTATREIRTLNNPKCASIPIIAMTANAFEEDRKKAIKAGMNGHIAKPISSDVILENLDQIFGR